MEPELKILTSKLKVDHDCNNVWARFSRKKFFAKISFCFVIKLKRLSQIDNNQANLSIGHT